jgi:hypothetical protein
MSSSNSTIARLRELSEANKKQAQEIELERLRTNYGLLESHNKSTTRENDLLRDLLARREEDLSILLEFVTSSGIEITSAVANVIAVREERRLVPDKSIGVDVTWKLRM